MSQIKYREGYKYQLFEDYSINIYYKPEVAIKSAFIELSLEGILTIKAGYAWDGATDTIQTKDTMRGGLVHDALYQLMRECGLPHSVKPIADSLLRKICLEDGMCWERADYFYEAVKLLGNKFTLACKEIAYLTAP